MKREFKVGEVILSLFALCPILFGIADLAFWTAFAWNGDHRFESLGYTYLLAFFLTLPALIEGPQMTPPKAPHVAGGGRLKSQSSCFKCEHLKCRCHLDIHVMPDDGKHSCSMRCFCQPHVYYHDESTNKRTIVHKGPEEMHQ